MIVDAGVKDVIIVEDSITGCVNRRQKGGSVNRLMEKVCEHLLTSLTRYVPRTVECHRNRSGHSVGVLGSFKARRLCSLLRRSGNLVRSRNDVQARVFIKSPVPSDELRTL